VLTTSLASMDLLGALRANTHRFIDVLRDVDPRSPVPTCEDWTAQDLAWHLAEVQWFWSEVVASGRTEPPASTAEQPPNIQGCLDLLQTAHDRLVTALRDTPDDRAVWSWHAHGNSVQWVRRRQAHEALVHRLDAEAVANLPSEVEQDLALDGIDELLDVYIDGIPDWASFTPSEQRVRVSVDGAPRTWSMALGRMTGTSPATGRTYDLPAALLGADGPADLEIGGTASAVHAWLWGRGPVDSLRLTGDVAVAAAVRELIADATQ
jgi:uncharacterized protein (TIGR03083 family)